MRVIAISTLKAFWEQYPGAEVPLKAWLEEAHAAQWQQPADIKFVGTHQQYDAIDVLTVETPT